MSAEVKPDPFERASKIRKGELDHEMPMFDELTGWIQRVPKTWLPALLRQVVSSTLHHKVFQDGKLVPYVQRLQNIWNEPHHGVLREDISDGK